MIEPASPMATDEPALSLRDPVTGRPLRVLITRPADQAQATADLVERAGGEALVYPCLVAAPPVIPLSSILESTLQNLQAVRPGTPIVAVTSRYAVVALVDALTAVDPSRAIAQALHGVRIAAVGPRTAEALASYGRPADYVAGEPGSPDPSDESSAAPLAAHLIQAQAARRADEKPAVLFLRAAEARPTLTLALRQAGFHVVEAEAYRMQPASPEALSPMRKALVEGRVDLVPFGSPRTVTIALSALGPQATTLLAKTRVGAIGQTTAHALREAGIRVDTIAPQARFAALLSALARL